MNKQEREMSFMDIFSPHVMQTRFVPGFDEASEQSIKEKESQIFEVIDEYIEQA